MTGNHQLPPQVQEQLDNYLTSAIGLEGADMASIQLYHKSSQTLEYIAHKGLSEEFLNHFKLVKAFDTSACGRAIGIATPVAISDVKLDIAFAPYLSMVRTSGFRAVKSVPLLADTRPVGVLSTHFREPRWSWDFKKLAALVEDLSDYMLSVQEMVTGKSS